MTSGSFSNRNAGPSAIILNYDAELNAYSVLDTTRSAYFGPARPAPLVGSRQLPGTQDSLSVTSSFPNFLLTYSQPRVANSDLLGAIQYVKSGRWSAVTAGSNSTSYKLQDFTFGALTADSAVPRTGNAGYVVGLQGTAADADFANLMNFQGLGVLTIDFSSGAILADGSMQYGEDFTMSGRAPASAAGTFNLSGSLSSTQNKLSGTITFSGIGSYSGNLNGRLYGPSSEELGGAFSASDGIGGTASGTLFGRRDPDIYATIPAIANLTQSTRFTTVESRSVVLNPYLETPYFVYNPATQTYAFYPANPTNAADIAYVFGPGQRDAGQSNTTFSVYSGSGTFGSFTAKLFNSGPTNPKLELTYSSFADIAITGATQTSSVYVVYGLATPLGQVPRSGSANYTGIVYGRGQLGPTALAANLDGTASFSANFSSSTFSSTLNVTATEIVSSTATVLAPINYSGAISGNSFSATPGNVTATNTFDGRFFGPSASEYGAVFNYQGTDPTAGTITLGGVAVGKRTP